MNLPEKAFYYHYKHTPNSINNYAYEVINVGMHTENDSYLVVYRPIYKEARVYQDGKKFDIRPLDMFMENVTKNGKTSPRFTKITDPKVISELKKIKQELYPDTK